MLPELNSLATNRYGPAPTTSRICWNGSVLASRSGMMKGSGALMAPSAAVSMAKGRFSR